ncbi:MAG: hypothetical protein PQJ49_11165 [Sphaerochaetaceae bacterium]|nr:hypothetical protein [Sphaerochaetaceae bacterium]
MAKAIDFKNSNEVVKGPNGNDLPVFYDKTSANIISCWELSKGELEEVSKTGKIWLQVLGYQPPLAVEGINPIEGEFNV